MHYQSISAVVPSQWCIFEEVDEVKLEGSAFDDGLNEEKAVCRFIMGSGEEHCKPWFCCTCTVHELLYYISICPYDCMLCAPQC